MGVPTSVIILSACVVISAALAIWADAKERRRLFHVLKPLTMILIIATAIMAQIPVPSAYKMLILAGLLFSLAGNIALMFPEKWFTTGLVSFLVAHVCYILAFKPGPGHSISAGVFIPLLIFCFLFFWILSPSRRPNN